jgi:hypothetical protein
MGYEGALYLILVIDISLIFNYLLNFFFFKIISYCWSTVDIVLHYYEHVHSAMPGCHCSKHTFGIMSSLVVLLCLRLTIFPGTCVMSQVATHVNAVFVLFTIRQKYKDTIYLSHSKVTSVCQYTIRNALMTSILECSDRSPTATLFDVSHLSWRH